MNREAKHLQGETYQFTDVLLKWHAAKRRSFSWRDKPSPYRILVAEVFLQRTPASRVERYFENFIAKFPDPETLAAADSGKLQVEFSQLGLKKRLEWLVRTARVICERFEGKVPDNFDDLINLPGVGTYTAAAVLSFGFGEDVPMVDVNVVRVMRRHFAVSGPKKSGTYEKTRTMVKDMTRPGMSKATNEALLDFGALVCRHRPLCTSCPVAETCTRFRDN